MSLVVAAFYKFVALPDCAQMQQKIWAFCQTHSLKGTILLAPEGINGTIAGSQDAIAAVLSFLQSDPRLADLDPKTASATDFPFAQLKVKLKQEIVTLGLPEINPTEQVGAYVTPESWNRLIADPDVLVIDTRNHYEVNIGTFSGAINPQTQSFREFPSFVKNNLDPTKHTKIAMFCTGGIRCEKASAYLLAQGFPEVYHLQGGILNYLEKIAPDASQWQGECFVFDERIAVKHGLEAGTYDLCHSCGQPISEVDKASPHYELGICCPHCYAALSSEKRDRQTEKQRQLALKSPRHLVFPEKPDHSEFDN
jgi:UPF0176 protein